ncbi:MAG: hypothetical protein J6Q93_01465 [Prevotella sp.]|nr:hypothetical protein [Prevotella sp.]
MSVNSKIRAQLPHDAVVFDNASYDNSIIGTSFDGRAIYSLEMMVEEYMADNGCCEEDARDWIYYNTLRALPYMGEKAPLVVGWEIE